MGRAAGGPDGQPVLAAVEVGDHPAGFQRNAGLPGEVERLFQHQAGLGEGRAGVAAAELAVEDDVVVHPGVNDRRAGGHRLLDAAHHRQRLVLDDDGLRHVLRGMGGDGGHGDDGVADEGHLARRHGVPVVGAGEVAGAGRGRAHRVHVGQHFVGGDDADGPRHLERLVDVDGLDVGVGDLAAHEGGVAHPRQLHVIQKPPAPPDHPGQLRPGNVFVTSHRALHSCPFSHRERARVRAAACGRTASRGKRSRGAGRRR